jgi:hypothetical protein
VILPRDTRTVRMKMEAAAFLGIPVRVLDVS